MFLLVPAYPGCPGSKAVKRSSLLLLLVRLFLIMTFASKNFKKYDVHLCELVAHRESKNKTLKCFKIFVWENIYYLTH